MNMNKKMLFGVGFVVIFAVGIAFYLGFKFHEQKTKIKTRDIREIQELKIATAFVRNPDWKFYQLDDPEKIKEALLNCEGKRPFYTGEQKLTLIFFEQNQYKIFELPFKTTCDAFYCDYGKSIELKEYLKEIPYPYATQWDTSQVSDSNDLKAPSPENR